MPRRSRIEEAGLSEKVIDLRFRQGMGPTDIAEKLMGDGDGLFTVESVTNFLESVPGALIGVAEEKGLQEKLAPILDYAGKIQKNVEDIEDVKTQMLAHFKHVMEMPEEEALGKLAGVFTKHGISEREQKDIILSVRRLYVAPFYFESFTKMLGELRKMMTLSAKIDKSGAALKAPTGPTEMHFHGQTAVLTGQDLANVWKDSKPKAP